MESVAFLFPGQGSQLVGMGRALFDAEPAARLVFEQADEILQFPLSSLCFQGPAEELTDTLNAQPAIFTTSIALLRVLEQMTDLRPSYVAGHSLGEFTALVAAGALDFGDGLRLVRERGRLMKAAGSDNPGGMAAILGLDSELVTELCQQASDEIGEPVQIANDNCPGQIVISGSTTALTRASELAEQKRARRIVRLQVSIASHSPLMASAAKQFRALLPSLPFREPVITVIGNTTARPLDGVDAIRHELVAQLTGQVRWTESIQYLRGLGVDTFIEIGPQDVLTTLMKRIDRKVGRFSIQTMADIEQLRTTL